ncbi:hypothetical protein [Cryptosporangium sp. NPDC051539]|uniref:hypothetical protein n=1 Tax=Cryptosporangium sp. NPDC051539 TaxID=3363962 RepID=UPI0037B4E1F0
MPIVVIGAVPKPALKTTLFRASRRRADSVQTCLRGAALRVDRNRDLPVRKGRRRTGRAEQDVPLSGAELSVHSGGCWVEPPTLGVSA